MALTKVQSGMLGDGTNSTTGSGNVVLATQPIFTSTIGVGGATASSSGAGISFPATQSASTNPNTLDDYEEGSWTVSVTPGSGSFTIANNSGYYIKIGRTVYVNCWWRRTGESGLGGGITVGGFPFPFDGNAVSNARMRLIVSGYAFAGLSSRSVMWVVPDSDATTGQLFAIGSDYVAGVNLTASNFSGNNTELYISFVYQTSS